MTIINTFSPKCQCKKALNNFYIDDLSISTELTRFLILGEAFPDQLTTPGVLKVQDGVSQENLSALDYFPLLGGGHVFSKRFVGAMKTALLNEVDFHEITLFSHEKNWCFYLARFILEKELLDQKSMAIYLEKTGYKTLIFNSTFSENFFAAKNTIDRKSIIAFTQQFVDICKKTN